MKNNEKKRSLFYPFHRWTLLTIFSLSFVPVSVHAFETVCEECDNPLVEVKDVQFEGDLPEPIEKTGWKQYEEGKHDPSQQELRGFTGYLELKKICPCADLYFRQLIMGQFPDQVGKKGTAKYEVRTVVSIDTSDKSSVFLNHCSSNPLSGDGVFKDDDQYCKPVKVDTLGKIKVRNELVALKNSTVYDTGGYEVHWYPEDPPGDMWAWTPNMSHTIDGVTYPGGGGGPAGDFEPSLFTGQIEFDKGDIGETIRRKETPTACAVDVDDTSMFPPNYVLKVNGVQNRFDEIMPDNVLVAMRAKKGEILGGQSLDGWQVFNTNRGKITDEVLYRPPNCGEAKQDTLEFAGVCQFHDGPPSVGQKRFTRPIINPQCHDAVLTITKRVSVTGQAQDEGTEATTSTGWDIYKKSMERREVERATVTVGLEFDNVADMWILGEQWAYYKPETVAVTFFSVNHMDQWYDYGHHNKTGVGFETTVVKTGRLAAEEKVKGPSVQMVALVYNRATKKPKWVVLAFSDIRYRLDRTEKLESRQWARDNPPPPPKDEERTSVITKTFQLSPVGESSEDPVTGMEIYPDFEITSGDGVNTFGGFGKKEYTYACRSIAKVPGEECRHQETYRWSLRRVKKKGQ